MKGLQSENHIELTSEEKAMRALYSIGAALRTKEARAKKRKGRKVKA